MLQHIFNVKEIHHCFSHLLRTYSDLFTTMLEKVTMVLKVDLQCCECHKKVKKILCKFPEIQDQTFDEKQNTVTIKVVSCCPEKVRYKLSRKGGGLITCIEIVSPKPPAKPKPPQEPNPPEVRIPILTPGCPPYYPFGVCCFQCYYVCYGGTCYHGCRPPLCYCGCYGRPPCNN
ncbi:Heavy metal transport/detoxification superfamily protein, putative isoform 1 [Melia azedarach]|uniref:Heavy metal transport/detoxification superfamily protein, putative isoform 1 n=1 Tax=Melia azedarach TaxID=155640 RepID=A0ACC1WUD0_MELAZ|nr:Heavy metal transport/detoxification superfamily protein, putative isoform 1 [Melia azedarach]